MAISNSYQCFCFCFLSCSTCWVGVVCVFLFGVHPDMMKKKGVGFSKLLHIIIIIIILCIIDIYLIYYMFYLCFMYYIYLYYSYVCYTFIYVCWMLSSSQ